MLNVIVRTSKSGGSLDYADLVNFGKRNNFEFIPCDIETVNDDIFASNDIFGVEFLVSPVYSFVAYSLNNDRGQLLEFLNKHNNLNKLNLQKIYFDFMNLYPKNTNLEFLPGNFTISGILKLMVEKGFAKSTTDALYRLEPIIFKYYNENNIKNLFIDSEIKFYIKLKKELNPDYDKIKNLKNCVGIIFLDNDTNLYTKIKTCEDKSISCLLCTEFSNHCLEEPYNIKNNSNFILKSQKKLFNKE